MRFRIGIPDSNGNGLYFVEIEADSQRPGHILGVKLNTLESAMGLTSKKDVLSVRTNPEALVLAVSELASLILRLHQILAGGIHSGSDLNAIDVALRSAWVTKTEL